MRDAIQHYGNPLHVYCRLCDLGLPAGYARTLAPHVIPSTLALVAVLAGIIVGVAG